MKTKLIAMVVFLLLNNLTTFAQEQTIITANSYDISDNLDLKAVASIFGESKDLSDFEYRINNPESQISNLDLNRDNQVDYIRVVEVVEKNTHLIVLQAVLDKDVYQDVATIEVEKQKNKKVSIQILGNTYIYGPNYIYEPVYVTRPLIFGLFWTNGYIAYHSPWYYGYYPKYYTFWRPIPIFRYRNHIHNHINVHNHYYYADVRKSQNAVVLHNSVRSNGYERNYPNNSFIDRNNGARNSYELQNNRINTRNNVATTNGIRNSNVIANNNIITSRNENNVKVRSNEAVENNRVQKSDRNYTINSSTRNNTSRETGLIAENKVTNTRSTKNISSTTNRTSTVKENVSTRSNNGSISRATQNTQSNRVNATRTNTNQNNNRINRS